MNLNELARLLYRLTAVYMYRRELQQHQYAFKVYEKQKHTLLIYIYDCYKVQISMSEQTKPE